MIFRNPYVRRVCSILCLVCFILTQVEAGFVYSDFRDNLSVSLQREQILEALEDPLIAPSTVVAEHLEELEKIRESKPKVDPLTPEEEEAYIEETKNLSEYYKAEQFFRFGRHDADHEINQYLKGVLENIFGEEAEKYHIEVLPEIFSPNAFILGDRTILVTAGLLRLFQYEDEIAAVIAHELIHGRRRHLEARSRFFKGEEDKGSETKLERTIGKKIDFYGLKYLQEKEADIRWIIESDLNVNPFAFVLALKRLKAYNETVGIPTWSATYGETSDRHLDVQSFFYFIHMPYLTRDLTEIPSEIKAAVDQGLENRPFNDFYRDFVDWGHEESQEVRQEYRIRFAKEMPEEYLSLAIELLEDQYRNAEEDSVNKERHEKVLNILFDRINRQFFSSERWPSQKRRKMAKWFFYNLREIKGTSRVEKAKIIGIEAIKNLQEINALAEVIASPDFLALPTPPLDQNPFPLSLNIMTRALDLFRKKGNHSRSEVKRLVQIAGSLSTALSELYQIKGTQTIDKKLMFQKMIYFLHKTFFEEEKSLVEILAEEVRRIDPEFQFPNLQETESPSSERIGPSARMTDLAESLARKLTLQENFRKSDYRSVYKKILQDLKGKSILEIIQYFDRLKEALQFLFASIIGTPEEHDEKKIFRDFFPKVDTHEYIFAKQKLSGYVLYRLFSLALLDSGVLKNRSEATRHFWQYLGFLKFTFSMGETVHKEVSPRILSSFEGIFVEEVDENNQSKDYFKMDEGEIAYQRGVIHDKTFDQDWDRGDDFLPPDAYPMKPWEEGDDERGMDALFDERSFESEDEDWEDESIDPLRDLTDDRLEHPAQFYESLNIDTKILSEKDQKNVSLMEENLEDWWFSSKKTFGDILMLYQVFASEDSEENDLYKDAFIRLFAVYMGKFRTWDSFFDEIEKLEEAGVPASQIIEENKRSFGYVLSWLWKEFPEKPNGKQLVQIKRLIPFVQDSFLQIQLETFYYSALWPLLSFSEKLETMTEMNHSGLFDLRRFNQLIEEEAKSEEDLHQAQKILLEKSDAFTLRGSREVGIFALLNPRIRMRPIESLEFLLASLESSEDDARLKRVFFHQIEKYSKLATYYDPEHHEFHPTTGHLFAAEELEDQLFRSGVGVKGFIIRKLLTGEFGLLSQKANRPNLLQGLLEGVVVERQGRIFEVIQDVLVALSEAEEWEPLLFALQPLLMQRFGISPRRKTPWGDIIEIAEKFAYSPAVDVSLKLQGSLRLTDMKERERSNRRAPWKHSQEYHQYSEELLRQKLFAMGIGTESEPLQKLSSLEFIIETVKHIGSGGVRFLQLLPQFIELSEAEESAFVQVYDAVAGQSKLTALSILEDQMPDFWDQVETIEERVGGGSLMTVYRVRLKNGKEEVFKILNPNLEFLLDTNMEYIESILDILVEKFGEKYEVARLAIQEVREWIRRDIHFEGFLEKDRVFKDLNSGFRPRDSRYSIYVPQSRGPANHYFIREEYVEGMNLTKWDELIEQGHDLRQVVSLITKNYINQLRDGNMIHSDVHIGNFRVTSNNRVAILDRNFFLTLDDAQKEFIHLLLNPLSLMTTAPEAFIERILNLSEEDTSKVDKDALEAAWLETRSAILQGDWKSISQFLVKIRAEGVKLPLEVTLIIKNLNALQQMAKKAGFSNLFEALRWSPGPSTGLMAYKAA